MTSLSWLSQGGNKHPFLNYVNDLAYLLILLSLVKLGLKVYFNNNSYTKTGSVWFLLPIRKQVEKSSLKSMYSLAFGYWMWLKDSRGRVWQCFLLITVLCQRHGASRQHHLSAEQLPDFGSWSTEATVTLVFCVWTSCEHFGWRCPNKNVPLSVSLPLPHTHKQLV